MYLNSQTKEVQSKLANYCRTGLIGEIPGANHEHIKHYRRLVFNIINDSLQSAYPLTFQLLTEAEWGELADEFFTSHPCQSPQVWWMPREFYEYIVETEHQIIVNYPFLPNLLEMEWLEVELFMMEDISIDYHQNGRLSADTLVLNPEHRLVRFDYPVHLKRASEIDPSDKEHYFLIMHREPETGKVLFMDISVFFARIIEILTIRPYTIKELIALVCNDFKLTANEQIETEVRSFIAKAVKSRLIISLTNRIVS